MCLVIPLSPIQVNDAKSFVGRTEGIVTIYSCHGTGGSSSQPPGHLSSPWAPVLKTDSGQRLEHGIVASHWGDIPQTPDPPFLTSSFSHSLASHSSTIPADISKPSPVTVSPSVIPAHREDNHCGIDARLPAYYGFGDRSVLQPLSWGIIPWWVSGPYSSQNAHFFILDSHLYHLSEQFRHFHFRNVGHCSIQPFPRIKLPHPLLCWAVKSHVLKKVF